MVIAIKGKKKKKKLKENSLNFLILYKEKKTLKTNLKYRLDNLFFLFFQRLNSKIT